MSFSHCEFVNLFCECVVNLCYSDANVGNFYSIGGSSNDQLGLECIGHNGHCTSHATLPSMTSAIPGVVADPVARLLVTPRVWLAQEVLS
jgi:hypothetical protein